MPTFWQWLKVGDRRLGMITPDCLNYFNCRKFEPLSDKDLLTMTAGAQILEKDGRGLKVVKLANGNILKFFRVKRWWSSALFFPYSIRFWKNSKSLQQIGIPTLQVKVKYQLPQWRLTAVLYEPLPGATLRQVAIEGKFDSNCIVNLGLFVAELHQLGVYFRSLHLGNIVQTPLGTLGLIDISDLKLTNKPLNCNQRLRNLRHLCRLEQDRMRFGEKGWQIFCRTYFDAMNLRSKCSDRILRKISNLINDH
jgi:hypothetical protein